MQSERGTVLIANYIFLASLSSVTGARLLLEAV